jgi:hypothetical protein
MKNGKAVKRKIFSVRCPKHGVEIGEWDADTDGIRHLAFWCGKCKKMIKFNKNNFSKLLTSGKFPVKYI